MRAITVIILLVLSSTIEADEFVCKPDDEHVKGNDGILVINKAAPSCGFKGQDGTDVFGIKTDELQLKAGDKLTISTVDPSPKTFVFQPPLEPGYILTGLHEPTIKFEFGTTDKTTSMRAQFIENVANVLIDGDNYNQLRIEPIEIKTFNVVVLKTLANKIHFESIGASGFTHSLLTNTNTSIPITTNEGRTVTIKTGPVFDNCSGIVETQTETSDEISGPDPKLADNKYKCVKIYQFTGNQGHIEVDFANFLDLTDIDDELLLDDGETKIKITKDQASDYAKRLLVFRGKTLAVVYNSPRKIKRSDIQFKLNIKVKISGGVVDKAGALSVPSGGQTHFVLRPQSNEFASLETKGQLKGADLTIKNSQSEVVTIADGAYLPPVLGSSRQGSDLLVDVATKSKLGSEVNFKPTTVDCHGIIYGLSGSISLSGGPRTCYWTLGAQKSHLIVDHTNLGPEGCLEIYSLTKAEPIFKDCNMIQTDLLPSFNLDQGYLKITLSSNKSEFSALIGPPIQQYKQIPLLNMINFTSTGYPTSYGWFSDDDSYSVSSVNKSKVLSVEDLDIRSGEKLLVDTKEIKEVSSIGGDVDISNKNNTSITLKRSMITNDFGFHRGYNLVVSEFQQIITADIKNNSITTHANLTSVLVKVEAPQGKRLQYNITHKSPMTDLKMSILDSRSVLGPEVYSDENTHGSTTSNTLLVSVVPLKAGAPMIPIIDIQYKVLECNKTVDHICDKETRCVPAEKLCKGKSYCLDESDLRVSCSSGPAPNPKIIEHGIGGVAVFLLCTIMFVFGAISALYGPDLFKSLETRFRSGQYTTFTSTE